MNDQQLLDRLRDTNPWPADADAPAGAWDHATALAEIDDRIGHSGPALELRPDTGVRWPWGAAMVAVAAVVTALVVGLVALASAPVDPADQPTPSTTATTSTTVVSSTTVPPQTGTPISAEAQSLLDSLERAYNRGDAEAAGALLAPDASVQLAPWVSPEVSPSSISLAERIATGAGFEERISVGDCRDIDIEIRCDVTVIDRFAEVLDLDPWVQTWVIVTGSGLIQRIEVIGDDDDRAAAMEDFEAWLASRAPDAPPVLVGDLEWQRTPDVVEVLDTHLVEYALPVSITPEAWAVVSGFYRSLSAGDIEGAEALFAPGGTYVSTDFEDVMSSAIGSDDAVVGSQGLRDFWTWQWQMMQTQWSPRSCSGDATAVVCSTELTGVVAAHLPGGTAIGTVDFTIAPDGIIEVVDRIVLGNEPFDIRSFWRTGILEVGPDFESVWPGGNGSPPFTTEFARIVLDLYPLWLADLGVSMPDEYLDGSLLENL